jgi:antitoxin (DNA-binding transcriptional repressor) of toxin-antitoxin stability system
MPSRQSRDNRTPHWRGPVTSGKRPGAVAERYELETAPVVSMRELNQRTSAVMDEINERGCPTLVTKHGHFIALITPLAGHSIESLVLSTDPGLREVLPGDGVRPVVENAADLSVGEFRRQLRDGRR